ncbi:MAG: hydrogenase/urease maturation nickel metallochaperone HypA [Nitrososphaerota archaeon]|nr:hydrogenase/urease maturation nickel metallochaperone HypA [Candidatus Bathyarchaeota archaeon]MCX8161465.1 hydrogenase/urease maturation nickel metallochaperone HypA [Candidatus Bathyarchaeota archaeon]MDW8061781.1 hydrogenase/urease maturation nickel metallochaperone HypA [Nitrososphaerota archaeon]
MHEFSIASQIIDIVLSEAKRRYAKKILEIRIRIGRFSFVNPDQLRFSLEAIASMEPLLDGVAFTISEEEAEAECMECSYRWIIECEDNPLYHYSPPIVRCPRCNGVSKFIKGRDCIIEGVRIEV